MPRFAVKIRRTGRFETCVLVDSDALETAIPKAVMVTGREPSLWYSPVRDYTMVEHESSTCVAPDTPLTPVFERSGTEASNDERAKRIDLVVSVHDRLLASCSPDHYEGEARSLTGLTDLLVDMRHWCQENGVSFAEALRISEHHHLAEQPYEGVFE